MNELMEKAKMLKSVAPRLAALTAEQKNQALIFMAEQLIASADFILEENEKDIAAGQASGLSRALLDRLQLTRQRIEEMAEGIRQVAELTDPVGEVINSWERPNGLKIEQVRVPLGVIGMIYEARPNVTVDAAALCLKTGNAVLLRGSSSAIHSNKALVHVIQQALEKSDCPADAVQLLEDTSRQTANQMFRLNGYLDVLIPRGGAQLIQSVIEQASVPVIETGVGNCHMYIDETADPQMAIALVLNGKTQRPSVCNAVETVLVHESWAKAHLQDLVTALKEKQVEIRADDKARALVPGLVPATEQDWHEEYLDLILAMKVVADVEQAIEHINRYGTKHSEAIISATEENVAKFFQQVDAAALYHNASTRFTDGFEFGFGAEIGISTQKLHARGLMGLPALTSSKYVIRGQGQIR
ncbi:glutamate-5-semialdehyde dehydrogenase [Caldalkalibacillus thermarum TA2.A1]|uniref:Gamma-glutamyl phosphate reductase n=1 Tax=Caldalkalibacillus thermarum (strain TA2.A1) TaxID=986075 RepID=A0A8X8I5D7_CALTT|nr:glutamate-5-semialdehyde dehydrogenase [Caldalkalibacillus thermarum]QZT34536.1 glutamate-5-semialdehyde dehydrogenase [Caldalkalibacillus thermarum TA2.A1]